MSMEDWLGGGGGRGVPNHIDLAAVPSRILIILFGCSRSEESGRWTPGGCMAECLHDHISIGIHFRGGFMQRAFPLRAGTSGALCGSKSLGGGAHTQHPW